MRYRIQHLFILFLFILIAASNAHAQDEAQSIDLALAQKYFQEAETICRQDGGKLWGRSLCGPMLFFDPAARTVVANQSDREGRLTRNGSVFVGRVPDDVNCANTAI